MKYYLENWCQWQAISLAAMALLGSGPAALADYPFSADIERVSGNWTGTQAELAWTTTEEYGTAGFRVFRQSGTNAVPLHEGNIPADITRPAGTYTVVDATQKEGGKGTYRLEELRGDGSLLTLGVWTVLFEEAEAKPPVSQAKQAQEATLAGMDTPTTGPAVKLAVRSNDVYAVSFSAIADVLGLTTQNVAERAEQALLALRCGDDPAAYLVDTDGGRILFYGWPATNTYTKANIFWIEPGSGIHIQRVDPDPVPVASSLTFQSTRLLEEDLAIITARGILRDDLYFWKSVVAGDATNGERFFDVTLAGYASGDVTVTVHLIGWNDTVMDPDHKAEIRFNGELLGSVFFDGKNETSASFTVPESQILESGNILHIRGILQSGHITSLFVIDKFEVAYTRYYAPLGALLRANDGDNARMGADLFTSPLVFDVTDPWQPVWIADASGVVPTGYSWPAKPATEWALREQEAVALLPLQPGGFGAWMRDETNAVDYLVIAPRAFQVPAQALADYRTSLGLRSAVALYEDICDQFAGGLNSPEAIRSFLYYAHQHWPAVPWMVVLGGWGHYDYLGATTTIANPLPPLLASDSATLRPADMRFADLTGNEIPDLAIGRIPVQSSTQFNTYIDKVKVYEAGGPQASYGKALFAADNADESGDFTASNLALSIEMEKRYTVAFTTLDSNSVTDVRADIRSAFTNGGGLIHYTGHGSYQQLAGENLLHVNDVNTMVNPPVPLFISLTCLIGRFDMLNTRSLAETLVLKSAGGALAVYAPSGLSWNSDSTQFGRALYRIHGDEWADAVGPVLLRTRQSFGLLSGRQADSLRTYNLLGDPALKLQGGTGGHPPEWIADLAYWRWERFSYAQMADPAFSYDAIVDFVATNGFLSVSPEEQTHGNGAADGQSLDVVSIVHWTAEAEVPWITITEGTFGENNDQVIYSLVTNAAAARSGTITVSGGGIDRTFTVHQVAWTAGGIWDTGFEDLGDSWRRLGWFGDYIPLSDGWHWHHRHGYFLPAANSTPDRMFMYTMDMGWLFTHEALYPYLYRFRDLCWLWYLPDSQNPRWFYNLTQEVWEECGS